MVTRQFVALQQQVRFLPFHPQYALDYTVESAIYAVVVQLVEPLPSKQDVASSSLVYCSIFGHIVQLVNTSDFLSEESGFESRCDHQFAVMRSRLVRNRPSQPIRETLNTSVSRLSICQLRFKWPTSEKVGYIFSNSSMVEHTAVNRRVVGSSPTWRAIYQSNAVVSRQAS